MAARSLVEDFDQGAKGLTKRGVVDFALKYGIASKLTSLVAVDQADGRVAKGALLNVKGNDEVVNNAGDAAGVVAVKSVMKDNVHKLTERGESIEGLVYKTDQLEKSSSGFFSSSS